MSRIIWPLVLIALCFMGVAAIPALTDKPIPPAHCGQYTPDTHTVLTFRQSEGAQQCTVTRNGQPIMTIVELPRSTK